MDNITPQQKKKLEKILKLGKQGLPALLEYLFEIDEKIENEIPTLKTLLKDVKGDKGDNYVLTDDDRQQFVSSVRELIKDEDIAKQVLELIDIPLDEIAKEAAKLVVPTKAEKVDYEKIKKSVLADIVIPTPLAGKDADESVIAEKIEKDLVGDLPKFGEQFRDGLELLQDGNKLSIEAIENLRSELDEVKKGNGTHVVSTNRNLYQLLDVDVSGITTNQSIKWDGQKWIPYTPSSGSSGVNAVVAGTGISVDATDPANPIVNLNSTTIASLGLADSALQSGDNVSELVNDAGYLTSYTETDTLASVTGRGATTSVESTFNAGIITPNIKATTSAGVLIEAANATDIGLLGAGNTANVAWYGSHTIAGNLIVDTNTLYVDATNNRVGINGVPTSNFHVFADGQGINLQRLTNGSDSWITFRDYVGGERGFFGYGSSANNNFYIWNGHSASMIFTTNGVTRQEITSTGNVAFDTNTLYVDAVNDRVIIGGTSSSYKFETIGTATIADRTWAINGSIVMYLPNQAGGQYLGSLFIGNGGRVATAGSALGNTGVGVFTGTALTTGADNTFIGYGAGTSTTTAIRNVFIGSLAGVSNTTGGENLFMGYASGYSNTTAVGNVAIGGSSLRYNATGSYNTAIGFTALATGGVAATVDSTTAIGYQAGFGTTGTSYGVYIGMFAGYANTTGAANTSIGSYTGYNNRTGNNNTYVGFESGYGVAANSHSNNSALGVYSLFVVSTGSNNTAIGTNAGYVVSTGSSNIFLGYNAGFTTTTGNSNVLLGYNIHTPAASTDNFMSLGNTIFAIGVNGTGTTVSSAKVGILIADPTAVLDIGASTTARSQLRLRSGTAPTSPNDGDFWYDGTDLKVRVGSVSQTIKKDDYGCLLRISTSTQQANGFYELLTWDTEVYDTDSMHNGTNPERITFTHGGRYLIQGGLSVDETGNAYNLKVVLNGSTEILTGDLQYVRGTAPTNGGFSYLYTFTAGDYIELYRRDRSDNGAFINGTDVNDMTFFGVYKVS